MEPQDVFKSLPRELRAMALAGHYLHSFAVMESSLNGVMAAALKLDKLQETIVCKNIQLRDKIKIARTSLSLAFMDERAKAVFDKTLTRITTLSNDRNMVAHDMFGPSPADHGGVEFLVAKANGKLQFPESMWTVDETEAKCDELIQTAKILDQLSAAFISADVLRQLAELTHAQPDTQTPVGHISRQSSDDQERPPVQGLLSLLLHTPTEGTSPQNPQEPEGNP